MNDNLSLTTGQHGEKSESYLIFLREIAAFKHRLEQGATLGKADTSRFISINLLEELIKREGETPDDQFYRRHRFTNGRKGFVETHQKVALALLPNLFEQVASVEKTDPPSAADINFARFVEAVHESRLPTTYPPSEKLLRAVQADTAEGFSAIFNRHADRYVAQSLKRIANENGLTHIPDESVFAKDTSPNAGLNYLFTYAKEHDFWCIATAIELSGVDFDEKDWTKGIILPQGHQPDIDLDLN